MDPSIWKALSSLKSLRALRHDAQYFPASKGGNSHPRFFKGEFPNLEILSHSGKATHLFKLASPEFLTCVTLTLRRLESPEEIGRCIHVIASRCPQLRNFTLHHAESMVLGMEHIRPLLSHRDLRLLRLIMPHNLSDKDIKQIALAFPNLTDLRLCPSPLYGIIPSPTLTLRALLPLARHSAVLKNLTIHIDTFAPLSDHASDKASPPFRFASLVELNFGISQLAAEGIFEVVLFLGGICARSTTISATYFNCADLHYGKPSRAIVERAGLASFEWQTLDEKLAMLKTFMHMQSQDPGERAEEAVEEYKDVKQGIIVDSEVAESLAVDFTSAGEVVH